ncbi:ISAs1 family transposase [Bradyrhizobium sp. AZCC 2289]|uniref:ISAs1 family transposase n=1 Tax=Bradyrhizobium sp. AZCC 2289 TaxID=3117026 RepID=UPI002FEEF655
MGQIIDQDAPRARLAVLLQHFSDLDDSREPWRVMYPLKEVLLVTCATIASCDDFDEIADWGEHNLAFLRRFSDYHHGIPCERWLRHLFNRVDPTLFALCFENWVAAQWPGRHEFIAIDGKTARRTHDRRKGLKALHTLSAYATVARLTLAQLSVPEKTNEITAIPDLLDHLAETKQLQGALVTIDAMGCQVDIAEKIIAHKADYLLALKGNQPNLETEVADYFHGAPNTEVVTKTTVEKGHGRIETRTYTASNKVDWIASERSYPGQPRFIGIKTLVKVDSRVAHADRSTFDTRYFICSVTNDIDRIARAIRGHWAVESMHWLLDVEFGDDLSRYRAGHGAKNMAVVRRFALDLVRANNAKGSVKTRRKRASWNPAFLLEILQIA